MQPHTSIALCAASAISLPRGDVPAWVHLLPPGAIRTVDGRGPYQVDAHAVAAAFKAGDKLPIDENHAIDLAKSTGQPSPARGWIVGLQARADGVWGAVEWNSAGAALMADCAYRGISPAILHNQSGKVLAVLRASLTNTPNLQGLTTLHSQDHFGHQPLDAADRHVIALMGLSEDEYRASLRARGLRQAALSGTGNGGTVTLHSRRNGLDAADRHVIALMGLSEDEYLANLRAAGLAKNVL
jgi:phage I-like protein